MTEKLVIIDYEKDSINANIDDIAFRADKQSEIVIDVQREIKQNDDTVSKEKHTFTLRPRITNEQLNGQIYERQTSEISKIYYENRESEMLKRFRWLYVAEHHTDSPSVIKISGKESLKKFTYKHLCSKE